MKTMPHFRYVLTTFILLLTVNSALFGKENDTIIKFEKPALYQECTHPGKYEPIGILSSCCTGKGDWTISYSYMNTFEKGNRTGTTNVSDDMLFQKYCNMMAPNTMNMQMQMLMAMYGLTARFSAMAMGSFIENKMTMNNIPSAEMHELTGIANMSSIYMPVSTKSSGLGDTKVFLFYKLRRECKYNIIIGAGINIPTGSTVINGHTMLGTDTRLTYPMQTGTGVFDIIPNITYFGQRTIVRENILSYGVEARADITPVNNKQGYSAGNQYDITAWAAYKFQKWMSCSLRIKGITQDKMSGFDPAVYPIMYNDPSANTENTGGTWINMYAGCNFYIEQGGLKNLRFLAEYGLPVYQNLNGSQLALKGIVNIGCKYSF